MIKTIRIEDISIKEFSFSKTDKWTVSLVYSLVDDTGEELNAKRIQFDDLTIIQQNDIENVLQSLISKVKKHEKLIENK